MFRIAPDTDWIGEQQYFKILEVFCSNLNQAYSRARWVVGNDMEGMDGGWYYQTEPYSRAILA